MKPLHLRTQRARWILLGVIALMLWELLGVVLSITTRDIDQIYICTSIMVGMLSLGTLAFSTAKWISRGEDDIL